MIFQAISNYSSASSYIYQQSHRRDPLAATTRVVNLKLEQQAGRVRARKHHNTTPGVTQDPCAPAQTSVVMVAVSSLSQTPLSPQTAPSSRLTPHEESLVVEETLLAESHTERYEKQEFEWSETDGTATAGVERILTREFSRLATPIFVHPGAFLAGDRVQFLSSPLAFAGPPVGCYSAPAVPLLQVPPPSGQIYERIRQGLDRRRWGCPGSDRPSDNAAAGNSSRRCRAPSTTAALPITGSHCPRQVGRHPWW